jgi:two-component system response regulator YesN
MIRLLLAEDERITREYVKFVIEENHMDIEILEANNGVEAVELARSEQPDLVIMDVRMPEMDGLKAGEIIKKEMPWIKVVILTAYDQFSYAQNAIRLHLDDYLLKPISPNQLIETIKKMVEHKEPQSFDYNRFDDIIRMERNLVEALIQKDMDAALSSVDSIFEGYTRIEYSIEDFKKYIIEIAGVITRRLYADHMTNKAINQLKNQLQTNVMDCQSIEQIATEMRGLVNDLIVTTRGKSQNPKDQNIQKAMRYISYHYHEKIYLSDIAKHVGYSDSYFSRLFKEVTGSRFSDYLNEYRIERAKKMMGNYQLTLGEIAARVGFEDVSYFSQVFHRIEEITPSQYRKIHNG